MNYELENKLAKELRENGFPLTTRWEIENNYRRLMMVSGESLPPLEAIMSEIKIGEDCTDKWNGKKCFALLYEPYKSENRTTKYRWNALLSHSDFDFEYDWTAGLFNSEYEGYGCAPIEAISRLWLAINKKS